MSIKSHKMWGKKHLVTPCTQVFQVEGSMPATRHPHLPFLDHLRAGMNLRRPGSQHLISNMWLRSHIRELRIGHVRTAQVDGAVHGWKDRWMDRQMCQELLILSLPSSPTISFQPKHIISILWAFPFFQFEDIRPGGSPFISPSL